MAGTGAELLVGVVSDPVFGPVLACGAGGTQAELLGDVGVRICPITRAEAAETIRSLKTFPLLSGFRGSPRPTSTCSRTSCCGSARWSTPTTRSPSSTSTQ